MMSHATVIKVTPQQDFVNELRVFIRGLLKIDRPNPVELTKTALRLLKNLPAARNAVFEYFSQVFEEAASNYIQALETELKTGELPSLSESHQIAITELHSVLVTFVADNPTAWAPIVSTWSLELLGEISTKFAGRVHSSTNLNATLQLWMNCKGTKILVDINTKCLSSLMHSDTEACISALLDTSTKHSPNFDWVVAHVGSCFPNTVITRVLSCGLKDFCQIKSYEQGCNSPKLRSVVGILGHLAGSHSNDICSAVIEMFDWSIQQNSQDTDQIKSQKKATVPFILQLAYLSDTFFLSICKEINLAITCETIKELYQCTDDWCKYFGSPEILEDVVLGLVSNCDSGGIHIINLLLDCVSIQDCASDSIKATISDKALELLQHILYRIDQDIRNGKPSGLLSSFLKQLDQLDENLSSVDGVRAQTAGQIAVFLGHSNPSILVRSVSHLLRNSTSPNQLIFIPKILAHELVDKTAWPYSDKNGYFAVVLEQILSRIVGKFVNEQDPELAQMWTNLLQLLKWETSGKVATLNSSIISRGIYSNFVNLTALFESEILHRHVIAEILDELQFPILNQIDGLPVQVVLNLTQSTVNYFFWCCKDGGTRRKTVGFKRANRILKRLCISSKVARVLALRELLERALFRSDNNLFGTKNNAIFDQAPNKLLLKQNKKINKTIPLTKHSSVFNGGIIGNGKRKLVSNNELANEEIAFNTCQLIDAIKSCCSLPTEDATEMKLSGVSLDSVTLVSLLLVQFVSPDVMYNGLPWPDEEFSKVTIERDLFIRRMFGNAPVLWDLLSFVAVHRPALCYCSVLIRALIATLIHQWKSTGDQSTTKTESYKSLMNSTIKVIDVMALGQLLPPPLSSIRDVLPSLRCYEIVVILKDCIWCYMRDHVPSPALFISDSNGIYWRDPTLSRPSEAYTNTLRIIMQRNIETLGHMYAQMFINVAKHE